MEDIVAAKRELYKNLEMYKEVVGIGIRKEENEDKKPYIVIYLSKFTDAILKHIPKEFKGNKVVPELTGLINSF